MLCMIVDKEIMRKDSKECATILGIVKLGHCRCGPVVVNLTVGLPLVQHPYARTSRHSTTPIRVPKGLKASSVNA